jgi:hypothetical protein
MPKAHTMQVATPNRKIMTSEIVAIIIAESPNFDEFVKSRKLPFSVIPAKAGIQ